MNAGSRLGFLQTGTGPLGRPTSSRVGLLSPLSEPSFALGSGETCSPCYRLHRKTTGRMISTGSLTRSWPSGEGGEMLHVKPSVYLLVGGAVAFLFQYGASVSAADRKPPGLKDATLPDLVIRSIKYSELHCASGNRALMKVTANVQNVSTKTAADLSKNNPWNTILRFEAVTLGISSCPGVIAVHTVSGPPVLPPGKNVEGSAFPVCVAWPGGYASHVAVKADPNNAVAESNENNNYGSLPINFSNPCH